MSAIPPYAICVADYYEDHPGHICRTTAVVTRLDTDQVVERFEAWIDDEVDVTAISALIFALASKYGVPVSIFLRPVPLQRCCNAADCEQYVDRVITRKDLLAANHVKRKVRDRGRRRRNRS